MTIHKGSYVRGSITRDQAGFCVTGIGLKTGCVLDYNPNNAVVELLILEHTNPDFEGEVLKTFSDGLIELTSEMELAKLMI